MRIRWKLLILLLGVALPPLAAMRYAGLEATRKIFRQLADSAHDELAENAETHLLRIVTDHSRLLRREAASLEQVVRVQSMAAQRCLAATPPADVEVYFAADFEAPGTPPPGVVLSTRHVRLEGGAFVPMPVSYGTPSFLLAPQVEARSVASDIARLSMLQPTYELLRDGNPDLIHWQYTSLDTGVHQSYPGHGHYPEGYDPRLRAWYREGKEDGLVSWQAPMVDASTGQVVLTLTESVRTPNGAVVGVTAIDVRITDLIDTITLPEDWAGASQVMVVQPPEVGAAGEERQAGELLILIRQDYQQDGLAWQTPVSLTHLRADDEGQNDALLEDMSAGRSGVRPISVEGQSVLAGYSPILQRQGNFVVLVPQDAIMAPARQAESKVLERIADQIALTRGVLAAVVIIVIIAALASSRIVTRPVRELASAARRIARGDFQTRATIRTTDELGELGRTFNEMIPQLQERMKIKQSLDVAMEVQQSLLPAGPPQIEGLDIAGKSLYCDETGGDYFDFLDLSELGPNRLGIAVGDVTGHGIAAALLMASARALLRSQADRMGSLAQLMNEINRHLCIEQLAGRFMTLFYLVVDTRQRHIRWSSAGHDPAICYDALRDAFSEVEGDGIPLGVDPAWQYTEQGPLELHAGQVLVIGTDGIWEARNPQDEMFGKESLRALIKRHAHESAERIGAAVNEAVVEFRQRRSQEDDITMVVIKVL